MSGQMCGGTSEAKPATAETQQLVDSVSNDVEFDMPRIVLFDVVLTPITLP